MQYRVSLLVLVGAALGGCFQELNTGAADGTPAASPGSGGASGSGSGVSGSAPTSGSAPVSGTSGSGDPPGEEFQTVFSTPDIEYLLPDGTPAVSGDACEVVSAQAMAILTTNCAGCHGGRTSGERQGQPPFDYVLDLDKLVSARSASVGDPLATPAEQIPDTPNFKGMRFVIPGDPDHSRIYVRAFRLEMPPPPIVGMPDLLPRPTVSDFSVLREWITNCVPAPDDGGDDPGGDPGGDGGAGGAQ